MKRKRKASKSQLKHLKALRKRFKLGEFKRKTALRTLKSAKRALSGAASALGLGSLFLFEIDKISQAVSSAVNQVNPNLPAQNTLGSQTSFIKDPVRTSKTGSQLGLLGHSQP